jgi:hypothetical protein
MNDIGGLSRSGRITGQTDQGSAPADSFLNGHFPNTCGCGIPPNRAASASDRATPPPRGNVDSPNETPITARPPRSHLGLGSGRAAGRIRPSSPRLVGTRRHSASDSRFSLNVKNAEKSVDIGSAALQNPNPLTSRDHSGHGPIERPRPTSSTSCRTFGRRFDRKGQHHVTASPSSGHGPRHTKPVFF